MSFGSTSRQHGLRVSLRCCAFGAGVVLATACQSDTPHLPDLPKQPDRWVSAIALDSDSKVKYVGKTKDYVITTSDEVRQVHGVRTIAVGDTIAGIPVGSIQCSFFWNDASYGGEQFMWRGRWGCMAGRSREELETAVGPDGEKRTDYVHVAPVQLTTE